MGAKEKHNVHVVVGSILLTIGAILFLRNFDFLPDNALSQLWHWPMILVVVGFAKLFNRDNRGPGLVLILIGGMLMVPHFVDVPENIRNLFWPAVFILIGLLVLFRGKNCGRKKGGQGPTKGIYKSDTINDLIIFSGTEKIINTQQFKGGKISTIFGGASVNMSRSKLEKGVHHLDFFAMFGGMELIIPEDWQVELQISSIFGGFEDSRIIRPATDSLEPEKKLIIKGMAIFGGGELKNS